MNPASTLDLSTSKVYFMAFNFVISEVGPQEVEVALPNGDSKAFNGPQNTAEHENWHTDGASDGFYTIATIGGATLNKGYRPGINAGANYAVKKAKFEFFQFTQNAPNTITEAESEARVQEIFEKYLTSFIAQTNILWAGAWHVNSTHWSVTHKFNDKPWTENVTWGNGG